MERLLEAIEQVHQAFGAPGDWGYGTPKGDALMALYRARYEAQCAADAEPTPRPRKITGRSALRVQPEDTINPQREF